MILGVLGVSGGFLGTSWVVLEVSWKRSWERHVETTCVKISARRGEIGKIWRISRDMSSLKGFGTWLEASWSVLGCLGCVGRSRRSVLSSLEGSWRPWRPGSPKVSRLIAFRCPFNPWLLMRRAAQKLRVEKLQEAANLRSLCVLGVS